MRGTLTLQTLLQNKEKYKSGNQENSSKRLIEWMAYAMELFAVVANPRFLVFLESLNHKFDCPSEKVLRTKLFPQVFAKV